ncbi:RNA polymerase sigma factor [Desulfitobacterium hafniense]|uniref:RNA polymerase subunit sigma-24 n=1 Tax=Desulfitobacterium hafniense (strain Y51) TaxID=138119 RepID=Q24Z61_DESHY|nr:sigma-70 family RNA polymerase sigma factor [Desulfitobacterium hafniense]BAE82681.1 hypothetical protein DSY0892 [Desulfitobacterium hafniense Y51]
MENDTQRTGADFSPEAILQLSLAYDKHANTLYRLGLMYLKNHWSAEEVVMDTFIKFMEAKPDFESPDHEKFWLIRTAINACKDTLKSSWVKKVTLTQDICERLTTSIEKEIMKELLELPPMYRSVIYMYYYEGYTTKEIALILGKRESTIRSQLTRGRALLKTILLKEGEYTL